MYWTLMLVTILNGPMDGTQTGLLYASMAECNAARNVVGSTLPYDYSIDCLTTDTPSKSPRPKARPIK